MTIKELYERAKSLGIEDKPCVFINRDYITQQDDCTYKYSYGPFIESDSIEYDDPNGFAVITGETEVGIDYYLTEGDYEYYTDDERQYLEGLAKYYEKEVAV